MFLVLARIDVGVPQPKGNRSGLTTNSLWAKKPRRPKSAPRSRKQSGDASITFIRSRLNSEFPLGFSVNNRQQLARPTRSHKIVHLFLRGGEFIDVRYVNHYYSE